MLALPMVDPVKTHQIGLVVPDREPLAPVVRALEAVARTANIDREFRSLLERWGLERRAS
jgi:hypothetical protein